MPVKPQVKKAIWVVWFLFLPMGIWLTYQFYPPQVSLFNIDILAFLLLTSAVAAMPIVINNTPIFFIQWVCLAVFLNFGLFAEMLLMQAAIIVLIMKLRIRKDELFRYPLNSLMFFLISYLTGILYYALGGTQEIDLINNPASLWFAVIYAVIYYSLNQVILTFILFLIYGQKKSFFGKDFVWETVTSLLTFPAGIILLVLYQQVGLPSLLFVGVPFAGLSLILNLYYSSEKINQYLQKAAEIGNQMAAQLKVNEVINLFIEKLTEMLPVDCAYILDVVDEKELQLIHRVEKGEIKPMDIMPLRKNEGISGLVWSTRKSALYSSRNEWKKITKGYMPQTVESVLCVPVLRNNQVIGVLFLASNQKRAFEKSQLMIVEILCSHFAVAIENARHYEKAKEHSERCGLTKLFNYRYFENLLSTEFNMLNQKKRQVLSLIILDIDHFKLVNDTYGHQSGNEILCELAARLTSLIGNNGTVARYGGEEFVILLPELEKEAAFKLAELIRQTIADRPFTLNENFNSNGQKDMVTITASIGVAAAPEDAEDSLALIRHADRALYVGAKQAGRNRVAEYIK